MMKGQKLTQAFMIPKVLVINHISLTESYTLKNNQELGWFREEIL